MNIFGTNTAAGRLKDRLETVENLVTDLQRANRSIELEFTELYDKVRHQMSRMAKRDAAARKNGEDVPEIEGEPDPLAHLDPVSKSIMLRRGLQGVRR